MTARAASEPSFDITFGALVTSDYNYRGYTLSDHRPSVSGYFETTYDILFAGVYSSSVKFPGVHSLQNSYSAGIRPIFGPLTVEAGMSYYDYPGSGGVDYPEYSIRQSYAVAPALTVGFNVYYARDYYRTGAWENYISGTFKYSLRENLAVSGELGHQRFGNSRGAAFEPTLTLPAYTYWNAGIAYVFNSVTVDLRYHGNTLTKQTCFLITGTGDAAGGSNGCADSVVVTLSWDSSLSALRQLVKNSQR